MMAWTILGAMLLQYPLGRGSDRKDRLQVLTILTIACTVLSPTGAELRVTEDWRQAVQAG